ncbi:MAG: hypothetical protein B6226_04905, partial [Candidatus Cloacimonetes bacterium 4572_65]
MLTINTNFNKKIYSDIVQIWEDTGVANSERGDTFSLIQKTLKHGGKIFTLCLKERIIGTAWVTHDFRRSFIHHVAIDPNYQNSGYGKTLIEHVLEYCSSLGYQIKLEVHHENRQAQHIYKDFGFTELGHF